MKEAPLPIFVIDCIIDATFVIDMVRKMHTSNCNVLLTCVCLRVSSSQSNICVFVWSDAVPYPSLLMCVGKGVLHALQMLNFFLVIPSSTTGGELI